MDVKRLFLLGFCGALSACQPYVGGPCSYTDPIAGQLVIEDVSEDMVLARFTPDRPLPAEAGDWLLRETIDFEKERFSNDVKAGDKVPVSLEAIIKGTCNPLIWDIAAAAPIEPN